MAKGLKLSKTSRWVLTIGILVILLGSAGVIYSRQKAEQSELSTSIAQAQQELIKYELPPAAQKEELEARLAEANSSITGLQNEFRQYTESIEIGEALFEAAENSNVTITRLSCSLPVDEEIRGITYRVFTVNITAEGEVPPALINFSVEVSDIFSAANIESVAMHVQEGEKSTIDLGLKVYVYE
jgi:hypothetical protein